MQAGSHNEGIIGNVVSSLMQLAVMTSAGLEHLEANMSSMKISQNRQILCHHIQQFSSFFFFFFLRIYSMVLALTVPIMLNTPD